MAALRGFAVAVASRMDDRLAFPGAGVLGMDGLAVAAAIEFLAVQSVCRSTLSLCPVGWMRQGSRSEGLPLDLPRVPGPRLAGQTGSLLGRFPSCALPAVEVCFLSAMYRTMEVGTPYSTMSMSMSEDVESGPR